MKTVAMLGFIGALAIVGPAFAQDAAPAAPPPPAEAPSCGGLLCDFGVVGSRGTALPCNDFLCRSFSHGDAAPPPETAPAPVAADASPPIKKVRRKKRVAKVVAPKPVPAAASPN